MGDSVHQIVPKRGHAFTVLILIALMLLATACGGQSEATLQTETATPMVTEDKTGPGGGKGSSLTLQTQQIEDNSLWFEQVSLDQGLSQSVVLAILQDRDGFMWFGTQDGLNRYDGHEFVVYKNDAEDPDSLSANFVNVLHEDSEGGLWIGTNGGGLDRLDSETGHFAHYQRDPKDPKTLGSNFVTAISEGPGGVLWLGTDGGGLARLDPATGDLSRYVHDPADPKSLADSTVQAALVDREGVLWVGLDTSGLYRLDPHSEDFQRYVNDPTDPNSLSNNDVQSIFEDGQGELWIGTTGGGLNRFDRQTEQFTNFQHDSNDTHSLSHNAVQTIFQDSKGALWIGTNGGGLDLFDRETERFVHHQNEPGNDHSLSADQVWSLAEDRGGVLWAGTFGGGLNKIDPSRQKFALTQADPESSDSLSSNVIWSLIKGPDDVLWVGTNGEGLNRLDRKTGEIVHYRADPADPHSLSNDTVWSLYLDRDGTLWAGTSVGLDRFDPETEQFSNFASAPVFSIYQDREGIVWTGTWGGGLGKLDPEKEQFTYYTKDPANPHSLADDSITVVREGQDGALWVGAFGAGLGRFDRETEQFAHYVNDAQNPHSLSHNGILSIHPDGQGTLWVGTAGGGLDRFDPETGTAVHYTEKDGLSNNYVYGILEEAETSAGRQPGLWLSTNRGLSRFDPDTETFRTYDQSDGLQSNEFNQGASHKSGDGEMFFGGVNGFNSFFPDQVRDNAYVPPMVLTSLTQGGEDVQAGPAVSRLDEVTFHWPRNFFEFEFAALSYAEPAKNEYAYKLEGFDADWIDAGARHFGRYTNLPGGTYTLRVKGTNNDGVWNEEGASLKVTVVPPIWRTWWFVGGVALALVAAAIIAYRLRVRSVEMHSRDLEVQVASRTKELAALNSVAAAVSRSLDLHEILNDALDKTLQVTETEGGGIYLLDAESGVLTISAHQGFGDDLVSDMDNLNVGEGFSGEVVQTGEPLVVGDISQDPRLTRMAARDEGFRSLVSVPLNAKGRVLGTLFAVTRSLREFTEQDVQLLMSIGHQTGVAVQNARLYEKEQQRADELDALRATMTEITAELELPVLLEDIVERATGLVGASGGELALFDQTSQELRIVVSHKLGDQYLGTRQKPGVGAMGYVAESGEPLVIDDYQTWEGGLAQYPQVRATMATPLQVSGRLVGVFTTVTTDPDRHFTSADLHLLGLFTQQAAIAIENARLYEQAQQLAVVEERHRLARDLHDSVTQALYGMTLYSEAAAGQLAQGNSEQVAQHLQDLQDTAQEALTEMRLLIYELRPPVLQEEGLAAALQVRLLSVEERAGLQTDLEVKLDGELRHFVEDGLYRIAQEALNNTLKHAHARKVEVHVVQQEQKVRMEIRDDGLGFDLESAGNRGGVGLSVMQERAVEIGAQLTIKSEPGAGTRVLVEVFA